MDNLLLTVEQRTGISRRKATCPFIGSAVISGELPVFGKMERPLAKVEDVVELGDSGGGDLGSHVLRHFAVGNHSRLPDAAGVFNGLVPTGFFSLDFPGSRGAHSGDSGILIEDPTRFESGRLSAQAFARLAALADHEAMLSTKAVGQFIADNVKRDSGHQPADRNHALATLFRTLGSGIDLLLASFRAKASREEDRIAFLEDFTTLASGDNLIRSSGEFGLLFAFLANRPGAVDDKVRLSDVEAMMVEYRFPAGWREWRKTARDWVELTGEIILAAWRA